MIIVLKQGTTQQEIDTVTNAVVAARAYPSARCRHGDDHPRSDWRHEPH